MQHGSEQTKNSQADDFQKKYYDILGLNPYATPELIKTTYRKLAFKYDASKWVPPTESQENEPQTFEEAQKKLAEINEAYAILIGKHTSIKPLSKSTPVPLEKHRRAYFWYAPSTWFIDLQPTNEAQFMRCITEDAKKYPTSFFSKLEGESLQVKKNFWKLISSDCLSYGDLESGEQELTEHGACLLLGANRPILWNMVYRDEAIIDFVVDLFNNRGLMGIVREFEEESHNDDGQFIKTLNWINSLCQKGKNELGENFKPITDSENFLLRLLYRNPKDNTRDSVRIEPAYYGTNVDSGKENSVVLSLPAYYSKMGGLFNLESSFINQGALLIIDHLRTYQPAKDRASFERFRHQLIYRSRLFFSPQPVLERINKDFFKLMQAKKNNLKLKPESKEDVNQLDQALYDIEQAIIDEIKRWIASNEKDPVAWSEQIESGNPEIALFEKVATIAATVDKDSTAIIVKKYHEDLSKIRPEKIKRETKIEDPQILATAPFIASQSELLKKLRSTPENIKSETNSIKPQKEDAQAIPKESDQTVKAENPNAGNLALTKPNFLKRHPTKTAVGAVTVLTALGVGATALEQYLEGQDPLLWLTKDVGKMGTHADLSVILALVVFILLLTAVSLAHKMLSQSENVEAATPIGASPS